MAGKLSIISSINKFIKSQEEELWTGTLEDYIALDYIFDMVVEC